MNKQMNTKLEKLREDAECASELHKTTRKFADASQKFLDAVNLLADKTGPAWQAAAVQKAAIACCDKAYDIAWASYAIEALAWDVYDDALSKENNDD